MSQYFDRDFLKFLAIFIVIVSISLIIILLARAYQSNEEIKKTETINTVALI